MISYVNDLNLRSTGKCHDYDSGDSYMLCVVRHQIKCFLENTGCKKCIPTHYKTQFEIMNISLEYCNTTEEFFCAFLLMNSCFFKDELFKALCQIPCISERYDGFALDGEHKEAGNGIIYLRYSSTDINLYKEYYVYDSNSFIGNVGGSLGLFIGFSYVDFIGKLLDYIVTRF